LMKATPTDLHKHTAQINAILHEICQAGDPAPLIDFSEGIITLAKSCSPVLCREVTTDFGRLETALRLPIPDILNPRFWIQIQERWEWKSAHKLSFMQCGLRLYMGVKGEEAIQFARLEWVAPTYDESGVASYRPTHAGHPHWHIDRSALVGQEDYWRSLEILTTPTPPQTQPEQFSGDTPTAPSRPLFDFSWLQNIHFPARAQWMQTEWDGQEVPGPHQCEPNNLDELTHWWGGALRYISAELSR
jgi:hypothetical protein